MMEAVVDDLCFEEGGSKMGRDWKEQRAAFNLLSGLLGLVLAATPWLLDEAIDPLAVWSAVFGGALVMRLGFSAALAFRGWKAWGQAIGGAGLIIAPWLLGWDGRSAMSCAHVVVGAAVVAIAATGLRSGRAHRTSPHDNPPRAAQPC
ncbi:SPW repeat domain-containing protein [Methylobacterium fujisawaense]|nr:SPW repeat protein [Methylobacterium organophilum]